jgi:hypothetical protein
MHLPSAAELYSALSVALRTDPRLLSSTRLAAVRSAVFTWHTFVIIHLFTSCLLQRPTSGFLLPPAFSPPNADAFAAPTTVTFDPTSTEQPDSAVTPSPSFSDLYPNLASLKSLLTHRLEQATSRNNNDDGSDAIDDSNEFTFKEATVGDNSGWMSEDLLPKEKSIINIKLVKRVRPHINVALDRNARNYLTSPQLDFESSFAELFANGCRVRVRRSISSSVTSNDFSTQSYSQLLHKPLGPLQAEISRDERPQTHRQTRSAPNVHVRPINSTGAFNRSQADGQSSTDESDGDCTQLPLHILKPYAHNLTQLVIFNTNVRRLRRFEFGSARLDKLQRLDVLHNPALVELEKRTFDGLARLEFLALINNEQLQQVPATTFAGAKQLHELLLIGNGNRWSSEYLQMLLRSATASILPNLVHLHVRGARLPTFTIDQWARADAWKMLQRFDQLFGREAISNYKPIVSPSHYEHIWHPYDPADWVDSEEDRVNVTSNEDNDCDAGFGCGPNCDQSRLEQEMQKQAKSPEFSGIKLDRDALAHLYQVRYLQLEHADLMHLHPEVIVPIIGNLSTLSLAGNVKLNSDNLRNLLTALNSAVKQHHSKVTLADKKDVLL